MTVIDKLPDIELPDVTKLELPKIDVEGTRKSAMRGAGKARSAARDAVSDRLPQRSGPSPLPFVIGGLLAGMTIGYFVATSSWFAPRVKEFVDQMKGRMNQMRSGSDEYGALGDTTSQPYTTMDLHDTLNEGDQAAQNQESYAV